MAERGDVVWVLLVLPGTKDPPVRLRGQAAQEFAGQVRLLSHAAVNTVEKLDASNAEDATRLPRLGRPDLCELPSVIGGLCRGRLSAQFASCHVQDVDESTGLCQQSDRPTT